jgi:hypothetical protein
MVFDKTHPAHVRRQLEYAINAFCGFPAGIRQLQVKGSIIGFFIYLVPLIERLDVDGTDHRRTLGKESVYQVPTDKPARSTDQKPGVPNSHDLNLPEPMTGKLLISVPCVQDAI